MKKKITITLASAALAAVSFGGGAIAQAELAAHYSRPDTVLISTQKHGDWKARCHDLHYVKDSRAWLFGGCLNPYHLIK